MGNCRSSSKNDLEHEMLPEEDQDDDALQYFAKIEKRNAKCSSDTAIPPPGSQGAKKGRRKRSRKTIRDNLILSKNTSSTEPTAGVTMSGPLLSPDSSQFGAHGVGGGRGVRDRAAMLEQAEANALMSHHMQGGSAINTGKPKFNLIISPKFSSESTGEKQHQSDDPYYSPRSYASMGGGSLRHLKTASSAGNASNVAPQRIPVSKRDTMSNRTAAVAATAAGVSAASSGTSNLPSLQYSNDTTTSDVILDYMSSASAGDNSVGYEYGSGGGKQLGDLTTAAKKNSSHTTSGGNGGSNNHVPQRSSIANFEASLASALVYTEIVRADRISAVAWELPTPTHSQHSVGSNSQHNRHVIAIGTDDGHVAIIDVEEHHRHIAQDDQNVDGDGRERPSSFVSSKQSQKSNRGPNGSLRRLFQSASPKLRELPPREGKVRSLCWSPMKANHLCIGGDDCLASIINVVTMEIVGELEREDRVYAALYSPNGQYVAVGGFDGMVAIASGTTMDLITEIQRSGLVMSVGWNYDGSLLAAGGSDKLASVIETEQWDVIGEIQRPAAVQVVRFYPLEPATDSSGRGQLLAVGGSDGVVAVVDIDAKRVLKDIVLSAQPKGGYEQDVSVNSDRRISSIVWSPDGSYMAIGGSNGVVMIVETKTFLVVQDLSRALSVTSVDWQSDGHYLAVGGEDKATAILKTGGITGSSPDDKVVAGSDVLQNVSSNDESRNVGQLSSLEWTLSEDFDEVEESEDHEQYRDLREYGNVDGHISARAAAI